MQHWLKILGFSALPLAAARAGGSAERNQRRGRLGREIA
jgi:hypothetical protein